jgi:hypothetical protein
MSPSLMLIIRLQSNFNLVTPKTELLTKDLTSKIPVLLPNSTTTSNSKLTTVLLRFGHFGFVDMGKIDDDVTNLLDT